MSSISGSILSTLSYHSRFSYPLTLAELRRFLIINSPVSSNEVKSELIDLTKQKKIVKKNNFYYLPNLPNLPKSPKFPKSPNFPRLRLNRQEASLPKLRLAASAARLIGFLPSVKLVCVTGSLAMKNSDSDDDIDLMIVTSRNRLWLTRPLVVLLVSLFFKRRRPTSSTCQPYNLLTFRNALCLNLWLDASTLAMPPHRRNLVTAHELAQMKPLINKNQTYEKMMLKNKWGRKYLANTWEKVGRLAGWQVKKHFNLLTFQPFNLLNLFAFNMQLWYMKPKITTEEVNLHAAFFHPVREYDNRRWSIEGRGRR